MQWAQHCACIKESCFKSMLKSRLSVNVSKQGTLQLTFIFFICNKYIFIKSLQNTCFKFQQLSRNDVNIQVKQHKSCPQIQSTFPTAAQQKDPSLNTVVYINKTIDPLVCHYFDETQYFERNL